MLVSAEELLLFLLDEENGTFLPLTERTEDLVLAGAVLMDLQLANRIDTDLDELTLSNPTPVGEDVLDGSARRPRPTPSSPAGRRTRRRCASSTFCTASCWKRCACIRRSPGYSAR